MIDGQLMNDVLTVLLVAAVFYGCAVLSYSFGSTDSEKMEIDRWLKLLDDLKNGAPHEDAIKRAIKECVTSHRVLRNSFLSPWRSSRMRSERGQTGDTK
jgi:hypothetical protein